MAQLEQQQFGRLSEPLRQVEEQQEEEPTLLATPHQNGHLKYSPTTADGEDQPQRISSVIETDHHYVEQLLAEHQLRSPAAEEPLLTSTEVGIDTVEAAPPVQDHVQLRPELQYIAERLHRDWTELASILELPEEVVQQLQHDNQLDDVERAEQLLHYWQLETQADNDQLYSALQQIGRLDLLPGHYGGQPAPLEPRFESELESAEPTIPSRREQQQDAGPPAADQQQTPQRSGKRQRRKKR